MQSQVNNLKSSTWPAGCIVRLCLLSGSQPATGSPPDLIRCSQSPRAGRPYWPLAPWPPPSAVYRQRGWPVCPGWPSPDTLQPLADVKMTSCTEKRLLLLHARQRFKFSHGCLVQSDSLLSDEQYKQCKKSVGGLMQH